MSDGAVTGPSGARCYTADGAARLLGTSGRNVRNWLRDPAKYPELKQDAPTAGRGNRPYYLVAGGVEALVERQGGALPPAPAYALEERDDWPELLSRQGQDLERERDRTTELSVLLGAERILTAELKDEVARLERHRKQLAAALAASSAVLSDELGAVEQGAGGAKEAS